MNSDYERLSNAALVMRGTWNAAAREEALRILRARGAWGAVRFLEQYNPFDGKGADDRHADWFWRHAPDHVPGGWLERSAMGRCIDCGWVTERRFAAGYQCPRCATLQKQHRLQRRSLAADTEVAAR
jgi:hypothetical protein